MFENDRKTKETQPDFNGTIDVAGTIYWINGWKAVTANGKKRLSLSVQLQEERHPASAHEDESWGGQFPPGSTRKRPDTKW